MDIKEKLPLTSAEIGKLWATYVSNTMAVCVITSFLQNVKDVEIKSLLSLALNRSKKYIQMIENIFSGEKYPVPQGFTVENDVNLNAPRCF